jgi:hypothetical protein
LKTIFGSRALWSLFSFLVVLGFWVVSGFSPSFELTGDFACCYASMAEQLIQGDLPNIERAVLPIGYSALLAALAWTCLPPILWLARAKQCNSVHALVL